MPELPEVQTVVSDLQKILPGKKITGIWVASPRPRGIRAGLEKSIGKKILGVTRTGKNIIIALSGNTTLLIHQKMTGHMLYGKFEIRSTKSETKWIAVDAGAHRDDPYNRFIRLVFTLSNGKHLALCDMRKFAKVLIWPTDKLNKLRDIKNLGPDPLEKSFDFKKFQEVLANKNGKIKFALMDQNIIAGIGNIYADEILWAAGVHPFTKIEKLKAKKLKEIFKAIKPILLKSIKTRGTSSSDFRDTAGKKGGFQKYLKVYRKEGEKCAKKDGGIIQRVKFGGRSSHFCPVHQKLI